MSFELLERKEPESEVELALKERQELVALMSTAIVAVYRAAKEQSDEDYEN